MGWISIPMCRMEIGPGPITVHEMPASDISNGRDHIPRYQQATQDVVPDDVCY
jgi:hypothetical protein